MPSSSTLRSKLRHLPARAGVYLLKDAAGTILYVGKAKSLRSRVRSYFSANHAASVKTQELVRRVADLELIVVDSEAEALILENNLIKEHRPRFNINLRDDKTYPYVKVTVQEPFPRILVTRKLYRDGARYFGPFTDVRRMRQALNLVKKLYTVRSCHYRLPQEAPARPCLDYHIGRCKAPCVGLQSQEDYRVMIDEILEVLGGHTRRAAARLSAEMAAAAGRLQFERAAELRDAVDQLQAMEARQKVVDVSGSDRDVLAIARKDDEACGVLLRIREGKLLGREAVFLSNLADESDEAVLATLASRLYLSRSAVDDEMVPPEVLFPAEFEDRLLVESVLGDRTGRRIRTRVPQRGGKVRLVELARQNAEHLLSESVAMREAADQAALTPLAELQEVLGLSTMPRSIVCFDVSHTQGTETVASGVVFEDARPNKNEYRRFRIRGEWGNDDFRSMQEAVNRYFRRRLEEGLPLPDLVVVDGGKGQLSATRAALEALGAEHQPIIGLAKREEEVFLPGRRDALLLPRSSSGLKLLQRMRDEAHRFAVTYNRNLRGKRVVRSELREIPGVGSARQRQLLERFGSVRGIARASEEQIASLPGFGFGLARKVLSHARAAAGLATESADAAS